MTPLASTATTGPAHLGQQPSDQPSAVPRVVLGVVGALLAVNAVVLAPLLFFDTQDYSEVAGTTVHLAHYVVWTACLVALSQLFPLLGGLRGRDGRGVPATVLRTAAVGAALAACAQFVTAFVNAFLADVAPHLLDTAPDAVLLVPLIVVTAVAGLAVAAFGIVGGTRRALSAPAAVLIVVSGVALPVLGPLSNALLGLGLVLVAWRGRWAGSGVRA